MHQDAQLSFLFKYEATSIVTSEIYLILAAFLSLLMTVLSAVSGLKGAVKGFGTSGYPTYLSSFI